MAHSRYCSIAVRGPERAYQGEPAFYQMSITQLLQNDNNNNVFVTVSISDLREFANDIVERIAALDNPARLNPVETMSNELMTIDEVCRYLGVTKPTLHRWNKMGYLTNMHVGRKVRYRREDVESFAVK